MVFTPIVTWGLPPVGGHLIKRLLPLPGVELFELHLV